MTYMVEVCGLTKKFAQQKRIRDVFTGSAPQLVTAIDNVSFSLEAKEIFGLLGPNGAGKTTLINMLCTLLIPTSGTARINGIDVLKEPGKIRRLVGLVTSNERSFYWPLTVRQNLHFFAQLYRLPDKETSPWINEMLDALDIARFADRRFDSCSTGVRQRVAFARAMLHRPRILFMDEPTKGLDPVAAVELVQLIEDRILNMWGPTIIITSHNLTEIEQLCKRVAIMQRGRLLKCEEIEALKSSVSKIKSYVLELAGAPEPFLPQLSGLDGVVNIKTVRDAASTRFEIETNGRPGLVSEMLRNVLANGADVMHCSEVPVSLQDVFSRVIASARQGG